jgi:hypothetical protein
LLNLRFYYVLRVSRQRTTTINATGSAQGCFLSPMADIADKHPTWKSDSLRKSCFHPDREKW